MTADAYYDAYWTEEGSGYRPRHRVGVAHVFDRRFPDGNADCLDVGCGDGEAIGTYLAAHGRSYVGVDVSETGIEQARARGLNAQVISDGSDLPFDDASFDFVACLEVLEHVFTSEETVAEIRRVMRPGGTLVVRVPNVAHWRHRVDLGLRGRFVALGDTETLTRPWRDPHIRFYTFDAMTRLLAHMGLRVVAVSGVGTNQASEIPFLHRFTSSRTPGRISQALFRARPTFFANVIQVVAER